MCLSCGADIKRPKKYCNNKCQQAYQKKLVVDKWLEGWNPENYEIPNPIRTFLLEEANYKCTECAWSGFNPKSGKTVLTIDHIDGNASNNLRANLRVLCPNCHAMTPTFGALNRGNGRLLRYM
jgi:5-methylcytosine-specific restriction endonuclease McrA